MRKNKRSAGNLWITIGCLLLGATAASAQQNGGENQKKFDEQSLALRTALHYNPSLDAPLTQLLEMYRGANKVDELVSIYRAHVTQYANDQRAQTVFVRLLAATGDAEAARQTKTIAARFPKAPYLQYLL